ncbi:hypothetical protein ANCDUO_07274 [Ancylostoma duodenale]|uniref:Uncharacterized protein n=1 Tax=Ancylostoma duodenale TaxID=51022 RepID=A0A0C2GMI3_9BILA|nr:hypothetical protein ANCDUO_07274 [Ancylostoma duodenale]
MTTAKNLEDSWSRQWLNYPSYGYGGGYPYYGGYGGYGGGYGGYGGGLLGGLFRIGAGRHIGISTPIGGFGYSSGFGIEPKKLAQNGAAHVITVTKVNVFCVHIGINPNNNENGSNLGEIDKTEKRMVRKW